MNRLSRQTSTFIATPRDGDNTVLGHSAVIFGPPNSHQVLIWGDYTQVAYAQAGLKEFEKSIRKEHAEKRKDFLKWEKVNALDARKEHREERKAKFEEIVAQHGKLESSGERPGVYGRERASGRQAEPGPALDRVTEPLLADSAETCRAAPAPGGDAQAAGIPVVRRPLAVEAAASP